MTGEKKERWDDGEQSRWIEGEEWGGVGSRVDLGPGSKRRCRVVVLSATKMWMSDALIRKVHYWGDSESSVHSYFGQKTEL